MDVSSSGVQGGSVQLNSVAKANQLMASQQANTLSSLGYSFGSNEAPNVQASPSYSPAIYAQAAQYQLYTQTGSLASILGSQGASPPTDRAQPEADTEIHEVEAPASTHVDTKA